MDNILITGASGFIAPHIINECLKKKYKVYGVDIVDEDKDFCVKDENYINGLESYGWGLGCRTLLDPSKQNNLGSIGEFGWAGAASTYFLVDNKKNLSATIMTQVLFGNPELTREFYKYIYSNF